MRILFAVLTLVLAQNARAAEPFAVDADSWSSLKYFATVDGKAAEGLGDKNFDLIDERGTGPDGRQETGHFVVVGSGQNGEFHPEAVIIVQDKSLRTTDGKQKIEEWLFRTSQNGDLEFIEHWTRTEGRDHGISDYERLAHTEDTHDPVALAVFHEQLEKWNAFQKNYAAKKFQ